MVITGASDGIGAELARQFANQGAWLALGARRPHELDVVAQDCIAVGGRAIVVPTDVTDPAQCEHLVARAVEAYGRVDVLVNNAGLGAHFAFEDTKDLAVFDHIMRVNYLGAVYCTHFALGELRKTRGRLVTISSLAAKTGVPTRAGYAASKHAVHGFFDSLRIELMNTGVSVTLIAPGFVKSSFRKHALDADGSELEGDPPRANAMSVEECARISIRAIARRQREVVMRSNWKLAAMLRIVAPGVIDNIARKAIERTDE